MLSPSLQLFPFSGPPEIAPFSSTPSQHQDDSLPTLAPQCAVCLPLPIPRGVLEDLKALKEVKKIPALLLSPMVSILKTYSVIINNMLRKT